MSADSRLKPPPCAICGAAQAASWRPFCSKRCADVDLGSWLTGRYVVAEEDGDGDFNAGRFDAPDSGKNL